MKYWISYLVAAIFAVLTVALTKFAAAHTALMDMVYPYMSRIVMSTLADWSAGGGCIWQSVLYKAMFVFGAFVILACIFKWNLIQWCGWVLAAFSLVVMLNTGLYELNAYASPIANDMRLQMTSPTTTELNETALYFREKANELATQVNRTGSGEPEFGTFEELAEQAGDGFKTMTYEKKSAVFAGSTVPVKKQDWFRKEGVPGYFLPVTGEAAVNPDVPVASLPFAMCKLMAQRMCIYSDIDSDFAAFLAASNNESIEFQYSAYLMAYYYCYEELASIDTPTARECAAQTNAGVNEWLRKDLEACRQFYSKAPEEGKRVMADIPVEEQNADLIVFERYTSVTQLFASWYIQEFVVPQHKEEVIPFDPFDPNQVDLSDNVNMIDRPAESTEPAPAA